MTRVATMLVAVVALIALLVGGVRVLAATRLPDPQVLVFVDPVSGHLTLTDARQYGRHVLNRGQNPATRPVWSPDGRWIAYHTSPNFSVRLHPSAIRVLRVDGQQAAMLDFGYADFGQPMLTWSANSQWLLASQQVYVQSIGTAGTTRAQIRSDVFSTHGRHLDEFATTAMPVFSPDGTQLLLAVDDDGRGTLQVMDVASKQQRDVYQCDAVCNFVAAWQADGRALYFIKTDAETLTRLDLVSGTVSEVFTLRPGSRYTINEAWHVDGTTFLRVVDLSPHNIRYELLLRIAQRGETTLFADEVSLKLVHSFAPTLDRLTYRQMSRPNGDIFLTDFARGFEQALPRGVANMYPIDASRLLLMADDLDLYVSDVNADQVQALGASGGTIAFSATRDHISVLNFDDRRQQVVLIPLEAPHQRRALQGHSVVSDPRQAAWRPVAGTWPVASPWAVIVAASAVLAGMALVRHRLLRR